MSATQTNMQNSNHESLKMENLRKRFKEFTDNSLNDTYNI